LRPSASGRAARLAFRANDTRKLVFRVRALGSKTAAFAVMSSCSSQVLVGSL
jgi:hypothetical protein